MRGVSKRDKVSADRLVSKARRARDLVQHVYIAALVVVNHPVTTVITTPLHCSNYRLALGSSIGFLFIVSPPLEGLFNSLKNNNNNNNNYSD